MKKLQRFVDFVSPRQAFRTHTMLLIASGSAAAFWFFTGSSGLASPNDCTFCHKRMTTMTLPCNSLEYRRHLDHGDTTGACAASLTAKESPVVGPKITPKEPPVVVPAITAKR